VPVHPVNAYGFAATFKLRDLVPLFSVDGPQGTVEPKVKERLLASYGNGKFALAFDFGAVVFVGCEPAEQTRIVDELRRRFPGEPHPPLTESFLVESGAPSTEVRFDRVLVPELTEGVVDIVGLILAQSVSMDYYASDVEQIEEQTDIITRRLETAGRIGRVKHLIQFIGRCIAIRNDILSTLALFDKPDATWDNEPLDRLWEGMYRMLELDDRYKALEAKLHMFQDNLEVLVDLTRQRQTLRLEWIVVLLILFEIVVMLVQILQAHH
jgi:uncharacterized Rmd1/YagE family protein